MTKALWNPLTKLPALVWLKTYDARSLQADAMAALIVTIMLIPQSLAYAMLAGLPPATGLYASILPLLAYALFGSSRTLAVGPVAVISLLSANAVGLAHINSGLDVLTLSMTLALLSGILMLFMGLFKLGFIANLLGRPVVTGFITAAGILIALGQFKHILGIPLGGHNLPELINGLQQYGTDTHLLTVVVGVTSVAFLWWARAPLTRFLCRFMSKTAASALSKLAPVSAVIMSILLVSNLGLDQQGVKVVGDIPSGLPTLAWPELSWLLVSTLMPSAIMISLIGYVESISVAQTLANKRRQQIDPNHELLGLGAANVASAASGGFAVTGGFSRSVVNFDAGAQTPMAGVFTAVGIALASLYLTPYLALLPKAVLGATIFVAVLTLIEPHEIKFTWKYSKHDFAAMMITIAMVLGVGVEAGVMAGVAATISLMLWRTSRPHTAIVGPIAGSEHFRNIDRHEVEQCEQVIALRIDESLFFGNVRYLDNQLNELLAKNPCIEHLILMASGINHIDSSAVESLLEFNQRLKDKGVNMHLSEVKGPVLDRLQRVGFSEQLTGSIYLSQHQAWQNLT
ncbi:MAG: sulfate permease [Oceanospirillaceae bacterium]|nr:sulfate permease [Oceanospirillaceae bacterium]MBT6077873.1 sulfate permease [Oceanospirillaceae bacterium]MBT7331047.1 sulfate permease [Oceanospirillaceae bacterium]